MNYKMIKQKASTFSLHKNEKPTAYLTALCPSL